jgi:hypothetical protein
MVSFQPAQHERRKRKLRRNLDNAVGSCEASVGRHFWTSSCKRSGKIKTAKTLKFRGAASRLQYQ